MKKFFQIYFVIIALIVGGFSCTVKKRKNETSKMGKFYHNTTSYYNGYWNAKEILRESMILMRTANVDDYNKILEVEDFVSLNNPKMVKSDMDKIIQKVTTVAQLHEPGDWVDDCYVMMGKAQYLKQEYETAEETLAYFQEDFNPANPYGRNYKSKKPTGKRAKKLREVEKKEKQAEKKKATKEKAEVKKEKEKNKEQQAKEKAKDKEAARKAKEKQKKLDAKNRKKGIKKTATQSEASKILEESSQIKKTTPPVTQNASQEKEEETYVPPVPQKPAEDKTAFNEGMLWLAKTYIKRENWFAAQLLLEKVWASGALEEIKNQVPATFANLYLKQKRYDEALVKLEEAIEIEDNRQLRARYAFISGQIYQLNNNYEKAFEKFSLARKWATDQRMEFMSDLSISKSGIAAGKITKEKITQDLLKMAEKEKYANFRDQIYFTLAEIELSQNNENKAIEYFSLSAINNFNDNKLKAESYFKIGELKFKNEKYLEARNYYDSTLMVLAKDDTRYPTIKKYVDNLRDIASNIESIRYNDTLLYFATLSGKEQEEKVMQYLINNKPKEEQSAKSGNLATRDISSKLGFTKNSNFFAYDKKAVERGIEGFQKQWGRIGLEDNWRRSMKATSGDLAGGDDKKKIEEEKPLISQEDYERFMREVPTNPIKKQEINDKIMNSMFTLGKLFRDKVNNYQKSAETLEGMHTRYGATPHELESYYYLYLDYLDLEQSAKAAEYKNRVVKKFPESQYAMILNDPNYLAKMEKEGSSAEKYYKKVYQFFDSGQHEKVVSAVDQAPSVLVSDNTYDAKLSLLRAMSLGNTLGREAYVGALNEVISGYPATQEQLKAKEILRFLGGDNAAFANIQDVDKIYNHDPNTLHYAAIVTYDWPEIETVNFKIAISEYNKKNFKTERLQLGDATLNIDNNIQVILVRKFENEEKCIDYYKKVMKELDEYSGGTERSFDVLPISQANYRKMISQYSTTAYRAFFEQVVLPNQSKK